MPQLTPSPSPSHNDSLHERVRAALARRRDQSLLRVLRPQHPDAVDFASNDYLGVVRSGVLKRVHIEGLDTSSTGSTGSRLLTGHSLLAERVEQVARTFHRADAALLFATGYSANAGFFSCLPAPSDAVVYDEAIHASVHDGIRASRAAVRIAFKHNDVQHLRYVLTRATKLLPKDASLLVAIESVYSMDGSQAPLQAMLDTAAEIGAHVVVDEAHAGGVLCGGAGAAADFVTHPALLARVVTFGKAFGAHGAVVLCSDLLRNYLINYARPLIYSTALPPHALGVVLAAYNFMASDDAEKARQRLERVRDAFHECARQQLPPNVVIQSATSIQGVLVPDNQQVIQVAKALRDAHFDVYPIRAPTVSKGAERIRIVLHAHNTESEVIHLVEAIRGALDSFKGRERQTLPITARL